MARRDRGILNGLIKCPWWVSATLAVAAYIIPYAFIGAMPDRPLFRTLASLTKTLAPVAVFVLLLVAALSAFFQFRKGKLLERQTGLDSVGELSWRQFESLVSEAFRRKGYLVLDNIEDGPDGGVDLRMRKNGELVFVQCKHWKTWSVGVKVVRELYGVMASKNVKKGIVVTYGNFTAEAKDFAKANSIVLINGPKLTQIISTVQQSGNMQPRQDAARVCPQCGSEMLLRVAKKGPHPGKKFWGCSRYPGCRGVASAETK